MGFFLLFLRSTDYGNSADVNAKTGESSKSELVCVLCITSPVNIVIMTSALLISVFTGFLGTTPKVEDAEDALEKQITRGWTSGIADSSDNNDVVFCTDTISKPSNQECISISSDEEEGTSNHIDTHDLQIFLHLDA